MTQDLEMAELLDNMVRNCMEEDDALTCAIDVIEAIPESLLQCRPQLLFFTKGNCKPCDIEREKYETLLAAGTVREVDSASAEGKRIMDRNNLQFTPVLAIIDCKGKLVGEFVDSNVVEGDDVDSTQPQS